MTTRTLLSIAAIGLAGTLVIGSADAATASKAKPKTPAAKNTVARTTTTKPTTPAPQAKADSTVAVPAAPPASADKDGADLTMPGGQEGTVFRSLTVEGEDRVHLEFERPELALDLDPHKAPGLDPAGAADVLMRSGPDLVTPFTALSARDRSPWVGHPWLTRFAHGAVARFRPEVTDVARWRLVIANARGETVATIEGKGKPPHEIEWDGRAKNGATVTPNLTYSYVFEAHDRAGNKRNFVGQGFKVAAYRIDGRDGPTLAFSARELTWPEVDAARSGARNATPPILLEAATWMNQAPKPERPVRVTVTARGYDQAQTLAADVVRLLSPHLVGDPSRVRGEAMVQPDAPEGGTVTIAY